MAYIFCMFITLEEEGQKSLNQEIDPIGDQTRAHCEKGNDVTYRSQLWSMVS